jgi:tRNA (cmo5U34)-methyltransferase
MDWQFNDTVATIFDQHARQHIPNYEQVIELSVDLCKQKLNTSSPILEIGCAIGETIKRLNHSGFSNIHAVDSSQGMLDQCPQDIATYYCSSTIPNVDIKFDATLCNWTLHFIKDKENYLSSVYNAMSTGGMLILSEKTENCGLALEQYHRFKQLQGVSDSDIAAKAKSLENVMFINSVSWYLTTLKDIGFQQVYIANAAWCFTTFVALK